MFIVLYIWMLELKSKYTNKGFQQIRPLNSFLKEATTCVLHDNSKF